MAHGRDGEDVSKLQRTLTGLGYLKAAATGHYGDDTAQAVTAFQKAAGLQADGIFGETTLAELKGAWDAGKTAAPGAVTEGKKASGKPLKGIVIGLDPGHQAKANYDKEPIAPGASKTKAKVSSGTRGVATTIYEYQLNLQVGLMLKKKLEAKGARVIMTRTKNNVNISNSERAKLMNKNHADVFFRIHANGSDNHSLHGMFIIVPSKDGYLKGSQQQKSEKLAKALLKTAVKTTGSQNRGLSYRNDETGNNWAQMPVCLIEMGFMTNPEEDKNLNSEAWQEKLTDGLVQGFLSYFAAQK